MYSFSHTEHTLPCCPVLYCHRVLYFRLIEELVAQVVLQRNGADPDFCYRHLDINIDTLISNMQQNDTESLKKRLEESDSKRHEVEASCEQLKKELAQVRDSVLHSYISFSIRS